LLCDVTMTRALMCHVQALLNIYLLPDVTVRTKQMILLYTFCDLINLAASETYKAQVVADSSAVFNSDIIHMLK